MKGVTGLVGGSDVHRWTQMPPVYVTALSSLPSMNKEAFDFTTQYYKNIFLFIYFLSCVEHVVSRSNIVCRKNRPKLYYIGYGRRLI